MLAAVPIAVMIYLMTAETIPGLMLINSIREMLCGDVMSGLMRLIESLIVALSIACGFAVPILLLKGV